MFMHYLRSNQTLIGTSNNSGLHFSGWILALLLLGGTVGAMAGEHHKFVPGVTRPGAYIFHNYCSVCHGDKGDGQSRAKNGLNPPPRNYTTPESAIELTRERMIHSVTNGRPGTAMISWKGELSPAEIEGVVDYIRTTFMHLENNKAAARKRPSSKLMASRGGVLYMQACAMCHGDTGTRATSGRMQPPPRDFTLPDAAAELTRERMIASVTHGRPGTAMAGYANQFSKSDIEAMVDFIRKAFMHAADRESPAPSSALPVPVAGASVISDMTLSMPLGLKGDPAKGGEFFMKTCATCHGEKGDGNGPRAFFISPPPRNFLLKTSRQRLNRPVLFEAITNGRISTNMPAWGKVLSKQEIADVAEFVFQHFISAPPDKKGQESKGQGNNSK
jgi:cytochrome c oxidase cbb3-type subunit III